MGLILTIRYANVKQCNESEGPQGMIEVLRYILSSGHVQLISFLCGCLLETHT